MRLYRGTRREGRPARVVWRQANTPRWSPLPHSLHLRTHSPSGFEWGYGGSGPAQLALALLHHALRSPQLALWLYQDFKRQVVAHLPHHEWQLSDEQIQEWLRPRQEKA